MNQQQTTLTQLLGSKELTFGCNIKYDGWVHTIINYPKDSSDFKVCFDWNYTRYPRDTEFEIIWHEPTLTNFHRWLNEKVGKQKWYQDYETIFFLDELVWDQALGNIPYNSSLSLLEQPEEVKQKIIDFISNS